MRTDHRACRMTRPRFPLALIILVPALAAPGCRPAAARREAPRDGHSAGAALPATASPKQVVKAFNAACGAGDHERALALSYAPAETDRQYVRSVVALGSATERLRKAVAETFGPAAEYELDLGLPRDEEFDDAVERIGSGGKEATVVMAAWKDVPRSGDGAAGLTRLIRRAGRWRIDARLRDEDREQLPQAIMLNRVFARSADLTASDVKAGKYADPADVAGAFRSRPLSDAAAFRDLLPPESSGETAEDFEP